MFVTWFRSVMLSFIGNSNNNSNKFRQGCRILLLPPLFVIVTACSACITLQSPLSKKRTLLGGYLQQCSSFFYLSLTHFICLVCFTCYILKGKLETPLLHLLACCVKIAKKKGTFSENVSEGTCHEQGF